MENQLHEAVMGFLKAYAGFEDYAPSASSYSGNPYADTHIKSEILLIKYMVSEDLIVAEIIENKDAPFDKVLARVTDITRKGFYLLEAIPKPACQRC